MWRMSVGSHVLKLKINRLQIDAPWFFTWCMFSSILHQVTLQCSCRCSSSLSLTVPADCFYLSVWPRALKCTPSLTSFLGGGGLMWGWGGALLLWHLRNHTAPSTEAERRCKHRQPHLHHCSQSGPPVIIAPSAECKKKGQYESRVFSHLGLTFFSRIKLKQQNKLFQAYLSSRRQTSRYIWN